MSKSILEILDYYDKHGHTPSVVAFLQNVPAEEAESYRKVLRKAIEES